MSLDLRQVIVKPLVTEKSSAVYQLQKAYTFEVHPASSKHQIREALEKLFDVNVTDVRTTGHVVIGNNVFIGANCTLLPGTVVGDELA